MCEPPTVTTASEDGEYPSDAQRTKLTGAERTARKRRRRGVRLSERLGGTVGRYSTMFALEGGVRHKDAFIAASIRALLRRHVPEKLPRLVPSAVWKKSGMTGRGDEPVR